MPVIRSVLNTLHYSIVAPCREEPRVLLLALSTMFMTLGQGMVAPILPLLVKSFGMTATMVGIAVSVFALARVFANIPAGMLTKMRGARFVLVIGALLSAGSNLMIGLLPNYTALVALRFVAGLGSAMFITAAVIFVAEVSTPQNRGRLMSIYQGGFLLGISMGPAVGGITASLWGLAAPFFLVGIVSAASAVWSLAKIPADVARIGPSAPKTAAAPQADGTGRAGSAAPAAKAPKGSSYLRNPAFIAISLIALATFFTRGGALFNLWPLLSVQQYNLTPGAIGVLFTIPSVANLALQPFVGTLADKLGRKRMIIPTMFLFATGLILSAVIPLLWVFAVALVFYGVAQSIEGPTANSYVADVVPREQRAMALSVFRTVADVGLMVGSPMLGFIADAQGITAGLLVNATLVIIPGVLFFILAKETLVKPAASATPAAVGGPDRPA